jgi:hypothetical protein
VYFKQHAAAATPLAAGATRGRAGDDSVADRRTESQRTVVGDAVDAGPSDQGGQALDERERLESQIGSSVAPWLAEAQEHVAAGRQRETSCGEGATRDVPAQRLQPLGLSSGDAHRRVQGEPIDLVAERSAAACREGPTGLESDVGDPVHSAPVSGEQRAADKKGTRLLIPFLSAKVSRVSQVIAAPQSAECLTSVARPRVP